jgi:uncharacterized protein involved in outer membrane biogenesis
VTEKNPKILRNLMLGAAAVLAVVVVAALAAPLVVPSGFIAGQIAALVRQKTGRALQITGPISFSLLPRVALVANDVALASPPGGFSNDFLTVKTVDVVLKPLPLLRGVIEIDKLSFSQPAINFEVDKDGQRNWIFHPEVVTKTTATPAARSNPGPSFAAGDVTIADGAASYLDQRNGVRRGASNLNMTLSLPSLDGPLKAAGTAGYNGQTVNLAITVASPGALRERRASAAAIDIASARGSFGFQGTIDHSGPTKVIGTVAVKTPSLRDLLNWTQIATVSQDSELGPLSIDGKVDFDGAKLALTDTTVTLDTVTAKDPFALTHTDGRFELDLDSVAFLGGEASGKITADATGPMPAIAATMQLKGITVHKLSFNIGGFDALSGTGDVAVDLTGNGKTMHELIGSLNGTASIAFANGTVGSAVLIPLMKNSIGPLVNDKAIPREIDYRSLSATATIAQGILHSSDLKLSGPRLSATGTGALNLGQRVIDFEWNPDIPDLGSARIAITGTWNNPDYKVESVNITNGKGLSIPGLKLR